MNLLSQFDSVTSGAAVVDTAPSMTNVKVLVNDAIHQLSLTTDHSQAYFLYLPKTIKSNTRIIVSIHGISRKALSHIHHFKRLAKRHNVILVAPIFSKERFPDYQRLGRDDRGLRADFVLNDIIAEVSKLTGVSSNLFYLFGYSGGGQFAHRYALVHPERVAGLAVGAAGWYTYPNSARRYPHGTKLSPKLSNVNFLLDPFLKIPVSVFVGEWDNERDMALNQSERIDRQQGLTRLERAERWINALRLAATAKQFNTAYHFEILANAGHSFTACVKYGNLAHRVFDKLLGAAVQAGESSKEIMGDKVHFLNHSTNR